MVKKRKILNKILSGSKNIRFDEFVSLLEGYGFTLKHVKGSHHSYVHPKLPRPLVIQPNSNKQAKSYQIQQFLKQRERYHLELEEDEEEDT